MGMTHAGRPRHRPLVALALVLAVGAAAGCSTGGDPEEGQPPASSSNPPARSADSAQDASRASGLIWDSGVFGHDVALTTQFEQTRGRKIDVLGVAPTRDSWEAILGDWWLGPETIPQGFDGTLNVSVPLFPGDGNMADAAAGKYNEQWKQFARMLAKKYPDAYVRPGWEMNIHNWPWAATPENVEQYRAAFRHASISMKEAAPQLRIVFNPNEGQGDTLPDASMAWPGDDVVDIVGLDAYDWSPPYDANGWEKHKSKDQGWDYWGNFARERGKKFALPEWGVIRGSENSGGDNPYFIDAAYGWMQANADIMAFETYFDEREDYCLCALEVNPKARDAYRAWMPKLSAREQ